MFQLSLTAQLVTLALTLKIIVPILSFWALAVFLKYDFKMNCARVQHSIFLQCYICIYVFASSFQFPTGPIEPEAENVTIPETWFASFT